jgi:hypothetical protein
VYCPKETQVLLDGVLSISLQMLGKHVPALPLTKLDHTIFVDQDKIIQAWHFAVKFALILLLIQKTADHAVMQQVPAKPVAAEASSLSLLIQPTVVHVVQHAQSKIHAAAATAFPQQTAKG